MGALWFLGRKMGEWVSFIYVHCVLLKQLSYYFNPSGIILGVLISSLEISCNKALAVLQLFQLDMQLSSVYLYLWKKFLFKCLVSSQLLLCAFLDVTYCSVERGLFVTAQGMSLFHQMALASSAELLCRLCVFLKAMLASSLEQTDRNKTMAFWSLMHQVWIFSFKQTL